MNPPVSPSFLPDPTSTDFQTHPMPAPTTYAELASAISSFLAVSIHQILYLRAIYPQITFLPVRQYNHPVRQSRHPDVCAWVTDACTAVEAQLRQCAIDAVAIHILSVETNRALERYTFDMTQLPSVRPEDMTLPFDQWTSDGLTPAPDRPLPSHIDIEAQFRAVLARLASACARLTPLPPEGDYTATLQIALRPNAAAPIGDSHADQLWIAVSPDTPALDRNGNPKEHAAEHADSLSAAAAAAGLHHGRRSVIASPRSPPPQSQHPLAVGTHSSRSSSSSSLPLAPGAATGEPDEDGKGHLSSSHTRRVSRVQTKTVPVRAVDAGAIKLEVWVEEAKNKFDELDRIYNAEHPE